MFLNNMHDQLDFNKTISKKEMICTTEIYLSTVIYHSAKKSILLKLKYVGRGDWIEDRQKLNKMI